MLDQHASWGGSLPIACKLINSRPEFVQCDPALTGIVRRWNKLRCYLQRLTLQCITSVQWQKHMIFYKRLLEYLSHSCSSSFQYIFSYLLPSSSSSSLRPLLSARASPRINSISPGSPLSISPNSFLFFYLPIQRNPLPPSVSTPFNQKPFQPLEALWVNIMRLSDGHAALKQSPRTIHLTPQQQQQQCGNTLIYCVKLCISAAMNTRNALWCSTLKVNTLLPRPIIIHGTRGEAVWVFQWLMPTFREQAANIVYKAAEIILWNTNNISNKFETALPRSVSALLGKVTLHSTHYFKSKMSTSSLNCKKVKWTN